MNRQIRLSVLFGRRYENEVTVSELKKRKALQEEAGEEMYKEPQTVPLLPRFIKEEETLSGASRGSAYHKFLELLDFCKRIRSR